MCCWHCPAGQATTCRFAAAGSAAWCTTRPAIGGRPSGSGYAPLDPQDVVLAADATLPQERVLTAGPGITLADGGAGKPLTIAAWPWHGAVGYLKPWDYDGVDGTARTVIANGAGDVAAILYGAYVVRASNGGTNGGSLVLTPGNSFHIYDPGGAGTDVCTVAVAADGSVTVQRTAGTLTYKVALTLLWI